MRFLLPAVLVCTLAGSLSAQSRDTVTSGEEVGLIFPSLVRFSGSFIGATRDSIIIRLSYTDFVPRDSVIRVEVKRCCVASGPGAVHGARYGAFGGLLIGAASTIIGCNRGNLNCRAESNFPLRATVFTATRVLLGVGIGALIGSRRPPKHWVSFPEADIYLPPPPTPGEPGYVPLDTTRALPRR